MSPPWSRRHAFGGVETAVGFEPYFEKWNGKRRRLDAETTTKEALLQFAQREIVRAMRVHDNWDTYGGLPASSDAARLALALCVHLLSEDNLPTPQITPDGHGGIDIEWLVSGQYLSAAIARQNGGLLIWATNADGSEAFSYEFANGPVNRDEVELALKESQAFLRTMSVGIRNRISIR